MIEKASFSSGNFLVQALLALTLIMAFMPVITHKIAAQKTAAEMNATAQHIEIASVATRIYLRENSDTLPYGITRLYGDDFVDALEPMGLPLGYVPKTPFGQDIRLLISKQDAGILALIELAGGSITPAQKAELGNRIGFWAAVIDSYANPPELVSVLGGWRIPYKDFGFKGNDNSIYVRIPIEEEFTELVRRDEINPELNGFLTDLDMNDFSIRNARALLSLDGNFGSVMSDYFILFGTEDGRKIKNNIETIRSGKATFRQDSSGGSALSIVSGDLSTNGASMRTISAFGESGNLSADIISIYDYSTSAGHSDFVGPGKWTVKENAVLENITMTVTNLEISSSINTARSQTAYIDEYGESYSIQSGIATDNIMAAHITLRDQTSGGLTSGSKGSVIIDIRPDGTSVLPDAYLDFINNDAIKIIAEIEDNGGSLTDCENVIQSLYLKPAVADLSPYNAKSLTQNLVCQYVYWQRLERRIDLKKCLLEGKSACN